MSNVKSQKESDKKKKNEDEKKFQYQKISGPSIGLLLVLGGGGLLLMSLFPSLSRYSNHFLLLAGIYFVVCSLFYFLHRIYLFVGEVLIVLWIGSIIENYAKSQLLWSICLLLFGLSMIFYSIYYPRKKKKREKSIQFLVIGIVLSFISTLLIFSVFDIFDFSQLWKLLRPVILILFGFIIIQRWIIERRYFAAKAKETKRLAEEQQEQPKQKTQGVQKAGPPETEPKPEQDQPESPEPAEQEPESPEQEKE